MAAPIFKQFMAGALEGAPATPFRIPSGIRLVRVNATTGLPAKAGDKKVILEAFKPGTVPTAQGDVVGGGGSSNADDNGSDGPAAGTGGLY